MTAPAQPTLTFDELRRVFPHAFVHCPACPLKTASAKARCVLCAGRGHCTRASANAYLKVRGLHVAFAVEHPGDPAAELSCPRCYGDHLLDKCPMPELGETSRRTSCVDCGVVDALDADGRCEICRDDVR